MPTMEVTYTARQWREDKMVTSSVTIGNLQAKLIVQGFNLPYYDDDLEIKLELSGQKEVYELSCVFVVYDSYNKEIDRSENILAKTGVSQSREPDSLKTVLAYKIFKNVRVLPIQDLEIQCNVTILDYDQNRRLHDINNTIFEKMKFADVNFIVQGKDFSAHKLFLTSCSRVFAAMFDHQMAERETNNIIVDDISHDVFHEMLRFIYTGDVKNLNKFALELVRAAEKYQLDDLKKLCEDALIRNMSVKNACEILILADRHSAVTLKSSAIKFINSNAKKIRSTINWKGFHKSYPHLSFELYNAFIDNS